MTGQTIRACLEQDGVRAGDTVIFALDTSGSFLPQSWAKASSDLRSALDCLGVARLMLLMFDTRIRSESVLHPGEFHRIVDAPLHGGGGGTDPRCLLTRFEGFSPIRIHVLTDGYFDISTERVGYDLRYLIWHNDYPQAVRHLTGARMIDLRLGA